MSLLEKSPTVHSHATDGSLHLVETDTPDPRSVNPWLIVILSLGIVAGALGLYIYLGEKPPVATAEIVRITAHPVHTLTQPKDAAGVRGDVTQFDQILLVVDLKLHNQSKQALILREMGSTLKLKSEEERIALAVSGNDYDRAFVAYPQLQAVRTKPLLRDITLEPGADAEGQLIYHYSIPPQDWQQRKSLDLKIQFQYQKDLILHAPAQIPEI